jgi:AcrR family transcriptional regulator
VRANSAAALDDVARVLDAAVGRGELTRSQAVWTIEQLTEHGRQPVPRTDGSNRRDDILQAATETFHEKGYQRATLDEIGSQVGLTKGTVYHYFASKREILAAICDLATSSGEAAIEQGLQSGGDPADRLRDALQRYTVALMQQQALSVLVRHVDELPPEHQEKLRERNRAMEQAIVDVLQQGVDDGSLDVQDTWIAALTIFGSINWLYSWYKPDGRLPHDRVRDILVSHIMNGLLSR